MILVSVTMRLLRRAWKAVCTRRFRSLAGAAGADLHVNAWSTPTAKTRVGRNCHFNGMKISGEGDVVIGDNFHSGSGCLIITSVHNFMGEALPYDDTYISKDVVIGKNVWIGLNVIILGGATIGDGVIVQAGSVVVGSVPPLAIIGGHPAKPYRWRDQDHYARLESASRYN